MLGITYEMNGYSHNPEVDLSFGRETSPSELELKSGENPLKEKCRCAEVVGNGLALGGMTHGILALSFLCPPIGLYMVGCGIACGSKKLYQFISKKIKKG